MGRLGMAPQDTMSSTALRIIEMVTDGDYNMIWLVLGRMTKFIESIEGSSQRPLSVWVPDWKLSQTVITWFCTKSRELKENLADTCLELQARRDGNKIIIYLDATCAIDEPQEATYLNLLEIPADTKDIKYFDYFIG
ncbi:11237_t:CDS:2 [Funneliformis mosseae]|uniref:11237_t:CDS:1 n=1 Tax=Funneliformis mosseae TaxID=27381 RepID=A0A9N9IC73_FUNMO|nr:11237_t:CDS:2 [Funneliformis mosseae]